MKKIVAIISLLLINDLVFAQSELSMNTPIMNFYEFVIKTGGEQQYDEVAKNNISSSVKDELGTLSMYSFKSAENPRKAAYMVEIYSDNEAYMRHLDSVQYKKFIAHSPEFIDKKKKIEVIPQFLGDKKVFQNEYTINNLVIVEVKPEFQQQFKDIVIPEMIQSLKIEDGVLGMYAATDVSNQNRWYFYEIYASEHEYQQHRQTLHFKTYIKQTANMTTAKESVQVRPYILKNKGGLHFKKD